MFFPLLESHTVTMQPSAPLQSPELQALLPLLAVPCALKVQFVRPQIRPCQFSETVCDLFEPGDNSNPVLEGPVPAWVRIPGYMVSPQLFDITRGVLALEVCRERTCFFI